MTGRIGTLPAGDRAITPENPRLLVARAGKEGMLETIRKYLPLVRSRVLRASDPDYAQTLAVAFDSWLEAHWDEYLASGVQHNLGARQKRDVDQFRESMKRAKGMLLVTADELLR